MTLKDRIYIFLFSLLLIIPISINAYSDYIVASGENVGIKIKSDGIIIVGTYKVDNQDLAQDAGLKVGDVIEIQFGDKTSKFEIIEIPKVQGKNMGEVIKIL